MKVRQLAVCQSCRSRKLGCDRKRPSCSQCLARNRCCPGYPADLIFVSPKSAATRQALTTAGHKKPRSGRRRPSASPTALSHPFSWPVREVLSLCALNFIPTGKVSSVSTSLSRICSAWVGVLPSLLCMPDKHFLSPAIRALGLTIIARGCDKQALVVDTLEARGAALNVLYRSISRALEGGFYSLAVAMICLYMSKVGA